MCVGVARARTYVCELCFAIGWEAVSHSGKRTQCQPRPPTRSNFSQAEGKKMKREGKVFYDQRLSNEELFIYLVLSTGQVELIRDNFPVDVCLNFLSEVRTSAFSFPSTRVVIPVYCNTFSNEVFILLESLIFIVYNS